MAITRPVTDRSSVPVSAVWLLLLLGLFGAGRFLTLGQPALAPRVFPLFALASSGLILVGAIHNRPIARSGWLWLALGIGFWAGGDTLWGWAVAAPGFPSMADVLYLLGYPCIAMALLALTVRPGTLDAARILDGLIAGLGYGFVIWSFSSGTADPAQLVWVGGLYPAFDIAIVIALAPLVTSSARSASAWLLVAGFGCILLSDSHYGAAVMAGTYMSGTLGDAGWILGYLCLGAAALHPSMASLEPRLGGPERHAWIRPLLLVTALVLPQLAAGSEALMGHAPDLGMTLAISSVMALLVVARLQVTLHEMTLRDVRFRAFLGASGLAALVKDRAGRLVFANDAAIAANRLDGVDWQGRTDAELIESGRSARYAALDDEVRRTGRPLGHEERADGPNGPRWWHIERFPIPQVPGSVGIVGLDITARVEAEAEARRLAAAVDQAHDSIVITDAAGRIDYVNPAFEALTGHTREEVIGQNPRILKSGRQSDAFYRAMWATLLAGRPWVAEFVNRAKGGALFIDKESISPIRDDTGAITHYVAVHHDVTHERELETRELRLQRERVLIADTLRRLDAEASPEDTAEAICRQIVSLTDVASADVLLFGHDDRAISLALVMTSDATPRRRVIPRRRAQVLRERAAEGPWVEQWVNRPWHPYNTSFRAIGVRAAAYAPVHAAGELIGVLAVASAAHDAVERLTSHLPGIAEFAEVAGALLGPAVAERTELARVRARVQQVITAEAFHPVFQPIVDHVRGITIGYEALTRFDDGVPPDARFAEAVVAGLGVELEEVTLRRAIAEAERLPRSLFVSINVSADLLRAARIPQPPARHRHLMLEITEHAVIDDYEELREATKRLGPRVMLAVDDAGAGFASLRHILELRPSLVKLDRSLIADIDADAGRRALVVGMVHFAREAGCWLVAEGVETPAELEVLRASGVRLGQGYLLGRPSRSPAAVAP